MEAASVYNQTANPFSPNTYTIKLGESFKSRESSKRNRKSAGSSSNSSDGPQYFSYKCKNVGMMHICPCAPLSSYLSLPVCVCVCVYGCICAHRFAMLKRCPVTSNIDLHLAERKATLEKVENDQYIAEWAPVEGTSDSTEIVYDAIASGVQEVDCLLIFDEETQTFTLERPAMKFTLKKSRRKRILTASQMALPEPLPASSKRHRKEPVIPATEVTNMAVADSQHQSQSDQRRSSVDDQDLFSKEVDEAWNEVFVGMDDDDDEDEGEDEHAHEQKQQQESSDTDVFEEVVVHPLATATPIAPQRPSAAMTPSLRADSVVRGHKHKLPMASEPILRLDKEDPPPRREHSGKTLSPRMLQQRQQQQQQKRKKTSVSSDEDDDESSSGSSSSGSSSSGSSSGSSSSGSDSEDSNSSSDSDSEDSNSSSDDDIDDLAADISRDLASAQPSAPASPAYGVSNTPRAFENTLYGTASSPAAAVAAAAAAAVRHTPTGRSNGPMSLRALFAKNFLLDHLAGLRKTR
ncbi:hypothetical protein BX666DRAFT_254083 [Dichotomocladium elegans]|nr:hypothetical protein BX666DRAFT_254083 [Dichotomocladium elegans]